MRKVLVALAALTSFLGCSSAPAFAGPVADQKGASEAVQKALLTRLPRTKVNKVDCSIVQGICEVQAGTNIFYVDPSARFLMVGRLYDLETKQDLTASSLLAVNPDRILSGAPSSNEASAETAAIAPSRAPAQQAGAGVAAATNEKVSLANLSAAGGMIWGGNGPTVTVFSDFHCGYCKLLHQALKELGAKVIERPISILGTRNISDAVYCSANKAAAIEKAYAQETIEPKQCDTSGLDVNEKFAREHNFDGTPVIVRSDGAVLRGFRPKEFLAAWLKDAGK